MLELRFMSLKYDSKDLIEDLIDNKILPKEQYISKADLIDREQCSECQKQNFEMRLQRIKLDSDCKIEHIKLLDNFESYNEEKAKIGEEIFNILSLFHLELDVEIIKELFKKCKIQITNALEAIKELFQKKQSKIENIYYPTIVLGTINGNYLSLKKIYKKFFPTFPHNIPIGIVTLGNYFNNNSSFEAFLCLLLMKLVHPSKVIIIRGLNDNIEWLEENNCLNYIKDIFGEKILQLIIEIIDYLPLCAIIDDKIFVSHSGIPLQNNQIIENINFLNENKRIIRFDKKIYQQLLNGKYSVKIFDHINTIKESEISIISVDSTKSLIKFYNNNDFENHYFNNENIENFLKQNSFSYFIRTDSTLKYEPFIVENKVISLRGLNKINNNIDKLSSGYVLIQDNRLQMISFL